MNLGLEGLRAIEPVYRDALALHTAEPGHLPFGETAYIGVEVFVHFLIGAEAFDVARDMTVFEAIAQQPLFGHAAIKEAANFVNHPFFETLTKTGADTFNHYLARIGYADDDMLHIGHVWVFVGMLDVVFLYFKSTEQTVAVLSVCMVVQLDIASQTLREFLVCESLHTLAELGVDRRVGKLVAFHHGFDIHARASAEDGLTATRDNVVEGTDKVVLKLIYIIFIARVMDVDEVIGNIRAVDVIVGKVLARSDIHAAKDLPRVGTNNLTAELESQFGGEACLTTSGWTCYGEEFSRQRSRVCPAACRTRTRRSRQERND